MFFSIFWLFQVIFQGWLEIISPQSMKAQKDYGKSVGMKKRECFCGIGVRAEERWHFPRLGWGQMFAVSSRVRDLCSMLYHVYVQVFRGWLQGASRKGGPNIWTFSPSKNFRGQSQRSSKNIRFHWALWAWTRDTVEVITIAQRAKSPFYVLHT